MRYAAKHYVSISGRKYTPGEIIDIPIPEEKLKRLLRLKAIERSPIATPDPDAQSAVVENGGGEEGARSNDVNQPIPKGEASLNKEPAEEADEEAEAPEIDVMDGIVSAAGEAPSKEAEKKTTKGRKKA